MSPRGPGQTYLSDARSVSLHETFVANVTRLCKAKGWVNPHSQGGHQGEVSMPILAAKSGIPVRTVENLMRRGNQPTMVGAAAIARALGVSLDYLLGQDSAPRFYLPAETGSVQLSCIHKRSHLPQMPVCGTCLAKWQSYQQRLNALYEQSRARHREANPPVSPDEIAKGEREAELRVISGRGCGAISCVNRCNGDHTWETCPAAKRARQRIEQ